MTEPLFRFMLNRPAAQPPQRYSISLIQDSALQGALRQAAKGDNPLQAVRDAATQFTKGLSFVGDPTKIPLAADLDAFSTALDELQLKSSLTISDFTKAVTNSFGGEEPAAVVQTANYTTSVTNLKDSLLAIKQLQELHSLPVEALVNQLRSLDFIANLAETNPVDIPQTGTQLLVLRSRPLDFDSLGLKSIISDRSLVSAAQDAATQAAAAKNAQIQALVTDVGNTRAALSELTAINSSHIVSMTQTASEGSKAPDALSPNATFLRQANLLSKLSDISLKYLDPSSVTPAASAVGKESVAETTLPNTEALTAITHFTDSILKTPTFIAQSLPPFQPVDRSSIALKLTPDKIKSLSQVTTGALQKANISLSTIGVDRAVSQLSSNLFSSVSSLNKIAAPGVGDSVAFKMIGGAMVTIRTPMSSPWSDIFTGGQLLQPISLLTDKRVPPLRATISPAGVADLLVVNQQLKAYEGADVSTIENVLKSEKRSKTLTTTRTTTSVTTTQTSTTDQETKDLESTTRFEMSKEADNQIKSDESLKAGVNVSASYGPSVKLSASVEGSTSTSQTQSTKAASSYSQDITQKASKTITTQVQQSTSLTITDEVVEKDEHSFDNSAGTGNISGVYQWVTKVYEAQVFNYGLRVMYDFMIPEPGSFLIELYAQAQAQAVKLVQPPDLTITPEDIDETNYFYWVAQFGATDVTSPPDNFKSYAKEMSMPPSSDSSQNFDKTDEISLDAGYQALSVTITCCFVLYGGDDSSCAIDVVCGTLVNRFTNSSGFTFQSNMNDENGTIPVAMKTFQVSMATVTFEVKAIRTDKAMLDWRLDTFGKLWNAHKARMQEYNDALAQLQLNAGVSVAGSDPDTNLVTIRTEVKKNCISILTDQHYDSFDAVYTSSIQLPEIDLAQNLNQGPYVRFFEEAFEWEEMTWLTYPYFWGRKSQWANRLTGVSISDPDPVFQDFLESGYCRAVAPVRPGFETAVEHYLTYGELWNGGPLPPITDPLYVPIAYEIAQSLGKPESETPQGDPWDVRIPTTLIKLRKDDSLPTWTKQTDGSWKSNDS